MNTQMFNHPITSEQLAKLASWNYIEIPSIVKTLMCGDTGLGAMATPHTIVNTIVRYFENKSS